MHYSDMLAPAKKARPQTMLFGTVGNRNDAIVLGKALLSKEEREYLDTPEARSIDRLMRGAHEHLRLGP